MSGHPASRREPPKPARPAPEVAERLAALAAWHAEWEQQQLALGARVPFHPEGRSDGSDYNQHYIDLESSGKALDEFFARGAEIMRSGA